MAEAGGSGGGGCLAKLLRVLRERGPGDAVHLSRDGALPKEVIALARCNQVEPFLYRKLKDSPDLPEEVREGLRSGYLASLAANGIFAAEGKRVASLLMEHGVESMPLKGAVASEVLFGDPGLYRGGDIDLLVRREDLEKVRDLLIADGYRHDAELEDAWLSTHYHLGFWKGERFYLEAHWNLAKGYFRVPPGFWWEGAVREETESGEVLSPAPEKYLLYGIYRLFSHDFWPLKFFVFLDGLIGRYGEGMDWDQFFSWARRYRMERLAVFTLKVLRDLLGTDIPAEAVERNLLFYPSLKRGVERGLAEGSRAASRKVLYLLLLQSPREVVKAVAARIIPPAGELRIRYGIRGAAWKVWPWYLFNLVLLPWRIVSGARPVAGTPAGLAPLARRAPVDADQ
jgi:hypothetical protein